MNETVETVETEEYFYILEGTYQKRLEEPRKEYFPGGFRWVEFETGKAFYAGVQHVSKGTVMKRSEMLQALRKHAVTETNKWRRENGFTVMFSIDDLIVGFFDCGKNIIS